MTERTDESDWRVPFIYEPEFFQKGPLPIIVSSNQDSKHCGNYIKLLEEPVYRREEYEY